MASNPPATRAPVGTGLAASASSAEAVDRPGRASATAAWRNRARKGITAIVGAGWLRFPQSLRIGAFSHRIPRPTDLLPKAGTAQHGGVLQCGRLKWLRAGLAKGYNLCGLDLRSISATSEPHGV